jgi:hypothetical protein
MPGTATILLDVDSWDLVLDVNGDIAKASEPYSLAQDAASAIRTWLGEVYFDTLLGVPYLEKVLGRNPSVALLKSLFEAAAKSVPGVAAATCYISGLSDREVAGQVQVVSAATGRRSAANFTAVNPQAA